MSDEQASKRKIVLAGGTGFLGHALIRAFTALDYEIVVLSRSDKPVPGAHTVKWDARTLGDWTQELEGAIAVINLSGAPVAKKWTPAYKETIVWSRVHSTRAIGQAIQGCKNPPEVWINASATGIYGDAGDQLLVEDSKPGSDFLGKTTAAWEAAAKEFADVSSRLVLLRIGVVLGGGGGAFEILLKLTRRFAGAQLGDGRQWMSWIHLDDLVGIVVWAIESDYVKGVYNAVAPAPERNKDFMYEMRRAVGRPWVPPVPSFMLKLMGQIGGPPAEPVLASTRVSAEKLLQAGYRFQFPSLRIALAHLIPNKEVSRNG